MTLATELHQWLTIHPATSALVGERVYPIRLPQKATLPAIAYSRVSSPPTRTHSGRGTLEHPRYQLDCWAATYLEAEALAAAVIQALDGQRWGNVSLAENEIDDADPETGLFRRIVDVTIWHQKGV